MDAYNAKNNIIAYNLCYTQLYMPKIAYFWCSSILFSLSATAHLCISRSGNQQILSSSMSEGYDFQFSIISSKVQLRNVNR